MIQGTLLRGRGPLLAVGVQGLAALPPLVIVLWDTGAEALGLLAISLLVVIGWDVIFAAWRRRPFEPHGLTIAMIFVLFAPSEMPIWHLVVVLSLGYVIGEQVFGGRGFAFLSPATVTLALLLLALPDATLRVPSQTMALACLPGAALLLATGLLSLRVVLPFAVVLGVLTGSASVPDGTALFIMAFPALVFLIGDPTTGAVTSWGRIAHGALAAGLVWVFNGFGIGAPEGDALVFAALLASLFAPLLDHIAITLGGWRRGRTHV